MQERIQFVAAHTPILAYKTSNYSVTDKPRFLILTWCTSCICFSFNLQNITWVTFGFYRTRNESANLMQMMGACLCMSLLYLQFLKHIICSQVIFMGLFNFVLLSLLYEDRLERYCVYKKRLFCQLKRVNCTQF